MSVTSPFSDDIGSYLTKTLTHVVRAVLVLSDGSRKDLDVEGCKIQWDETQAPRVQASLSCRLPTQQDELDAIDPRASVRVEITLGYVLPGGAEQAYVMADLGLRHRDVSRPDDLMVLDAASDEALVIDNTASTTLTVNTATTTAGIAYIIGLVTASPTIVVTSPTGPAVNQSQPDGDKWDTMADLADRIGAKVYDDGLRTWRIEPVAALGTPAHLVAVGEEGTLVASAAGLGREDGFANRVYLKYEWTDASGFDHVVRSVSSITTGKYAATVGNTATLYDQRNLPTTRAQADLASAALVARTVTRGRSFSVQAIAAYWLRPGMTINVQLPLGGVESHLVSAVSFDPVAGLMDVTTRLPDNTGSVSSASTVGPNGDSSRSRSPGAKARKTTNQSLTTATYTTLSWDADFNASNVDSTVWTISSPTRFFAPIAGRYQIAGAVVFASNTVGYRIVALQVNGTRIDFVSAAPVSGTASSVPFCWPEVYLATGDYVEISANQGSGGALLTGSSGGIDSTCAFTFIASA